MTPQPHPSSDSPDSCPKCHRLNSQALTVCAMCGARLPWASRIEQQRLQERNEAAMQSQLQAQNQREARREEIGKKVGGAAQFVLPLALGIGALLVIIVFATGLFHRSNGTVFVPIGLIFFIARRVLGAMLDG